MIDGNTFQYGRPDGIDFYAPNTVTMVGNVVSNNTVDLQNILNIDATGRKLGLLANGEHEQS